MEKVVAELLNELESKVKELRSEYQQKLTAHVDHEVACIISGVVRDLHEVVGTVSKCMKGKD